MTFAGGFPQQYIIQNKTQEKKKKSEGTHLKQIRVSGRFCKNISQHLKIQTGIMTFYKPIANC